MSGLGKRLVVAALIVITGVGLAAQAHAPHNLTGKWVLTMADGPHDPAEMPLSVKQDGIKVTAMLTPPGHGAEFELKGEFVKGELTLAIPASDNNMAFSLKATLKDDGTLVGYTSSEMGDSKWIASRVK